MTPRQPFWRQVLEALADAPRQGWAELRLVAIARLHYPYELRGAQYCTECSDARDVPWPCRTARLARGEEIDD